MLPLPSFRNGKGYPLICIALASFVLAHPSSTARAAILYATSQPASPAAPGIVRVDTATNAVATVFNTTGRPDSLIFDNRGNLIYSTVDQNSSLNVFDFSTGTNRVIASGFSQARDITMEPGGASVIVSDWLGNQIDRVNLNTGVKTVLGNFTRPDGVTYDDGGHLFAVVNRGGPNQSVVQLDPTTGSIIKSLSLSGMTNNGDGITFDPFTRNLWVGYNDNGGGVIEISTSLSGASLFSSGGTTFADGLESDGMGHIYIANVLVNPSRVAEYDIATHAFTQLTPVVAIDDLAPLVGAGAPVPEPSGFILLGIGVGCLGVRPGWRRFDRLLSDGGWPHAGMYLNDANSQTL